MQEPSLALECLNLQFPYTDALPEVVRGIPWLRASLSNSYFQGLECVRGGWSEGEDMS